MTSFTNKFGQVLNPGDRCVVVTKCTGSVNIAEGEYIGLSAKGNVQARVDNSYNTRYWAGTDNEVPWSEYPKYPYGVKYGTDEYKAAIDDYQARQKHFNEVETELRKKPSTRVTTLQLNNIFKV